MSQGIVPPAAISTPSLSGDQTWTGAESFTGDARFTNARFAGPDPWCDVTHPTFAGGAKGDTSDDLAAFQAAAAAIPAAGGVLFIPPATSYYALSGAVTIKANTTVMGCGISSKVQTTSGTANIFEVGGDHVTIQDLYLVQNASGTGHCIHSPTRSYLAVYRVTMQDGSANFFYEGVLGSGIAQDIRVQDCHTIAGAHGSGTASLLFNGGWNTSTGVPGITDILLQGNYIENPVNSAIELYGNSGPCFANVRMLGNRSKGAAGAMWITGATDVLVNGNIVSDFTAEGLDVEASTRVVIAGNISKNCVGGITTYAIGTGVVNTTLGTGVSAGTKVAVTPASMANIQPQCQLFIDSGGSQETVIVETTSVTTFTAYFVKAHGGAAPVLGAGVDEHTGTTNWAYRVCDGVTIVGNTVERPSTNAAIPPAIMCHGATNLTIVGNTVRDAFDHGIAIYPSSANRTSAWLKDLTIVGNTIRAHDNLGGSKSGVFLYGPVDPGSLANVTVEANTIENFDHGVDARGVTNLLIGGNNVNGATTNYFVDAWSLAHESLSVVVAPIWTEGLRVRDGANNRQGLATLTGGTVTVSNTAVTANSRLYLTRQPGGSGTAGALGVTTITPGTSFVITSTSGTDAGIVAWLIVEAG